MSLESVADLLRCPGCGQRVEVTDLVLRCPAGHAFDVARQGYVNLTGAAQPGHADTAAMIAARQELLGSGRYDRVRAALTAAVPAHAVDLLDVGTGTGWYAAGVLAARPGTRCLGVDVSVAACRRAARAHPRLGVVAADAWGRLPVAGRSLDAVLSVFAPRHPAEFARVLRPDGVVITVTAAPDHLAELRGALGLLTVEAAKTQRLVDSMAGAGFHKIAEDVVRRQDPWTDEDAIRSVAMGPNAFHSTTEEITERTGRLTWPRQVTVSCVLARWSRQD